MVASTTNINVWACFYRALVVWVDGGDTQKVSAQHQMHVSIVDKFHFLFHPGALDSAKFGCEKGKSGKGITTLKLVHNGGLFPDLQGPIINIFFFFFGTCSQLLLVVAALTGT